MVISAVPPINEANPPRPGSESAAVARLITATITNLDRIRAKRVSIIRRVQRDVAGHTSAARMTGRKKTLTVTAPDRTKSSSHTTKDPMMSSRDTRKIANDGTTGAPPVDERALPTESNISETSPATP
jgi:hypothetical protein